MKMKILLLLFFTVPACSQQQDILINVMELVGKNKDAVSEIIGAATNCSPSKYGETCQFAMAETEIVFIQGRADWITIEGLDDQPFSNSIIQLLGFQPKSPNFSNAFTKRWEPIQGLISVSLFKGSSNSDYAYIKAYTN